MQLVFFVTNRHMQPYMESGYFGKQYTECSQASASL